MQYFYCLGKYILYYLVPLSKCKVQLIIRVKKPLDMNLRLPNLECLLMLPYDVIFVGQVLSYMHLQNLKAEVDQSLEPGRDHRQKRGTCFSCREHVGRFYESVFTHSVMQSLYTRNNLKLSSWRVILVQLMEKTREYLPKITCVLFLSPLTVSFQHKLTYSIGQ